MTESQLGKGWNLYQQLVWQIQLQFIDYLAKRIKEVESEEEKKFLREMHSAYLELEGIHLDENLGNSIAYFNNVVELKRNEIPEVRNGRLYFSDYRYHEMLESLNHDFLRFFGGFDSPTLETAFLMRKSDFAGSSLSHFEKQILENEIQSFIRLHPQIEWRKPLGPIDAQSLLYEMDQRVEALKKALADF